MLTCFDIADYFLRLAIETNTSVNNLKLQKLVYYAQAWHLALYGQPLFQEEFEAWVHGPVIPELFRQYQDWSWRSIETNPQPNLPLDIQEFLAEVADEYLSCDADELERLVCQEDPWLKARQGLLADEPAHVIIRQAWMKEYYSAHVIAEKEAV